MVIGLGDVDLIGVFVDEVDVMIIGSGDVLLMVMKEFDIYIMGSGFVFYFGLLNVS